MSVSSENFIKTIYRLELGVGEDTKPGTIAKALGVTNAAATDMARKLADKNLIYYKKYQQLSLAPEGKKLALDIIRKHRLWESFLHKVFNLSLHEIHREAELLEHQTSDFLAEKISQFLNNPVFDPHGDPIPDADGDINSGIDNIVLSHTLAGETYEISRLSGSDKDFFDFCGSNNIHVGSTIKIEKQYEKSRMTEILTTTTKLLLNSEFTNTIYVRKVTLNP